MDNGKLLRVDQLADKWSVSTDTVKRHIKSGKLPAINMGTGSRADYRIAPDDADAFINRRKVNAIKYSVKRNRGQLPQIPNYLD